MRKITFLLSTFLMFIGTMNVNADVLPVDRTGWSIKASSWCNEDGVSGNVTAAIDGSTTTYWHSNWGGSPSEGGSRGRGGTTALPTTPEYIILDLGVEKSIAGIGYVPRNDGSGVVGNGALLNYKLYVSTTAFSVPVNCTNEEKQQVLTLGGDVKNGTLTADDPSEKRINLDTPTLGRYIMLVWLSGGGPGGYGSYHANCAELNVYEEVASVQEVTVTYKTTVNGVERTLSTETKTFGVGAMISADASKVPAFTKFTGATSYENVLGTTEYVFTVEQDNAAIPFEISESFASAKWYQVRMHINNAYFWQYNGGTAVGTAANSTSAIASGSQLWCFVGNVFDGFKAYNKLAGDSYTLSKPNTGNVSSVMTTEDTKNAFKIYKSKVAGTDDKVCFKLDGDDYYLNRQGANIAGWWDNDEGSCCDFFAYTPGVPAYRRESTLLPDNTYMMFNAGVYSNWIGMIYYDGGVKVEMEKKPSAMSSITGAYKWKVTKDDTGYKLYSATNLDQSVNANGELNGEYIVIDQYNLCDRKCSDDVSVLLEDETTTLAGSATTAEHKVYTIHNPQNNWGWAVNGYGMIYRNDGFFPFAFYTQYPYTNEQWDLYLEAKDAIANAGKVGYPKKDNATGAEIKALLLQDPATEGWAADLQAKVDAYKVITDVQMPEDGKAYTITSVNINGVKRYMNYTEAGYQLVETSGNEELPMTAVLVCRKVDDANNKYVFTNNAGKYFMWKGGNPNVGFNDNKGYNDVYDTQENSTTVFTIDKLDVSNKKVETTQDVLFGYLAMKGRRKDRDEIDYFVVKTAGGYDHANAQFFNSGFTSALLFEEVSYENTPELKAADGIEGIEAIATWSAPFATVVPAGVEAYVVSSEDGENASVEKLAGEGEAIPANEGVLLTGAAGKVTMVPVTTETVATVTTNLLANTAGAAKAVGGKHILAKKDNKVAFYVAADGDLGMNKAYLDLSGNGVREISFDFNATAIESVEAQQNGEVKTYDLSGRRVQKAVKGLYIQNGKKVIVK